MLLYFFGFLRLFSFHCVFLMCCFMSTGDRSYLIPACPGLSSRSFDFLNIAKMLRCAIAIKLNGETLRQVRTLYTHNADSHLKITQSVYFTHWYFKTYGQTW